MIPSCRQVAPDDGDADYQGDLLTMRGGVGRLHMGYYPEVLSFRYGPEHGAPTGAVTALSVESDDDRESARFIIDGRTWRWRAEGFEQADGPVAAARGKSASWAGLDFAIDGKDGAGAAVTFADEAFGLPPGSYRLSAKRFGIPYEKVTCVSAADGVVWFGSDEGAMCWDLNTGKWRYFWGRRWLAGNTVTQLAALSDGRALIGTDAGLTFIDRRWITLEEKALAFSARAQARHDRLGLVSGCGLQSGDYQKPVLRNSDNDGLWTAMYLGGEVFRAALTGDPQVRELCRKHMNAVLMLHDITENPGFPARSYDLYDDSHPLLVAMHNREIWGGPDDIINKWRPANQSTWKGYQWKGDTSPDETDGHIFILSLYYQLLADDTEKPRIRDLTVAMVRHIIDSGYYLRDTDGKETTWGKWAPERLNTERPWVDLSLDYGYMKGKHSWWMDRGLRSLSILVYLGWAAKLSGDSLFTRELDRLIDEHGYDRNAIFAKCNYPPTEVNHSDDEMMYLLYDAFARLQPEGRLRQVFEQSLARSHKIEKPERNPCWNFVAGRGGHRDFGLLDAVEDLRRKPLDCRHFAIKNSQRDDIEREAWADRHGRAESKRALWPDERPMQKYNGNPYELDAGGNGESEEDGGFFVLSYWMGRYYGFIQERFAPREEVVRSLDRYIGITQPPPGTLPRQSLSSPENER